MGFYSNYILPKLINCTCSVNTVRRQREKVVPFAQGNVLEIGIGSGLNLPFYDSAKVKQVVGLDPIPSLLFSTLAPSGRVKPN